MTYLLKHSQGFTLIELIIFIMVTSLLGSAILVGLNTIQKTPVIQQQQIALQTARQCIEWYIGQRRMNGYSTITCPSTTVPSYCTAPSGYTLTTNVDCTTISSDASYQTITVTVSGNGSATLTTLIGNY